MKLDRVEAKKAIISVASAANKALQKLVEAKGKDAVDLEDAALKRFYVGLKFRHSVCDL
jgi:hypothetical protein